MPIVGDVLADRYRLEAVLGVGGMASVYRAVDLRLDRQVAVKVLVANLAADPSFAKRFNREAGAMAGFSHPNVAAVYDVEAGEPATGREPFYVMEYCDGGSLADRLKAGPIPPAVLVPIVSSIADGLVELHRHGLIHRDVKPANILFSGDRPKLADFGIARSNGPHDGTPLTLPGSTIGTLAFLAPELGTAFDAAVAGALDADPAARPSPASLAEQLETGLGISGVARPNPGAMVVDVEAPTVVAVGPPPVPVVRPGRPVALAVEPVVEPAVVRRTAARSRAVRSGSGAYVGVAIVLGALLVAVFILPRLLAGGSGGLPNSSSGSRPTPTLPLASPTALPSARAAIIAALDQVDAAIAAARGGKDGLNGHDGNELAQLARAVRLDVDRGDLRAATTDAQTLSDRARELTANLDKKLRDPLAMAIDALLRALAAT